jgi:hypothetical protein
MRTPGRIEREALDRAIRRAVLPILQDQERVDRLLRAVAMVMLEETDLLEILHRAELEHGRRNAASIAARQIVDRHDPAAVENMAQLLRKKRRKANRGSVEASAAA